jgi:hypothetical protein
MSNRIAEKVGEVLGERPDPAPSGRPLKQVAAKLPTAVGDFLIGQPFRAAS